MEDRAPAHIAAYNNRERGKLSTRIYKAKWPSFSPDFNPIEHIWDWMREKIYGREKPVETGEDMKRALIETWEALTVEKINSEIDRLPHIMLCCLSVGGKNNYPG